VEKSKLFEPFNLILAVTADLITVGIFLLQQFSSNSIAIGVQSFPTEIALYGCLFYSWLVLSWILVRRYWQRTEFYEEEEDEQMPEIYRYFQRARRKRVRATNEFSNKISSTVFGIGILVLTFSLMIAVHYHFPTQNVTKWVLTVPLVIVWCLSVAAFLIYQIIVQLMPVIHLDIKEQ
jgi:hypothetical protein